MRCIDTTWMRLLATAALSAVAACSSPHRTDGDVEPDGGGDADADADEDRDQGDADSDHDSDPDPDPDRDRDPDPEPDHDPDPDVDQDTWVAMGLGGTVTDLAIARNGDILAAGDGGYIWVARYDPRGALLWQRWYGHEWPYRSRATAVAELSDERVALGGGGEDPLTHETFGWLGVLERDGRLLSQVRLPNEVPLQLFALDDGSLVLSGDGVALFAADGTLSWARWYLTEDGDRLSVMSVHATERDILLGAQPSDRLDLSRTILARIGGDDEVSWAYRVRDDAHTEPFRALPTADGGAMILGASNYVRVAWIGADGVIEWTTRIGNEAEYDPYDPCWECGILEPANVELLPDGDIGVVGTAHSVDRDGSWIWVGRLDGSTGAVRWQRRLGASGVLPGMHWGAGAALAADDERIIVGGVAPPLASLDLDGDVEGGCSWLSLDDQPEADWSIEEVTPITVTVGDVALEMVEGDLVEHDLPSEPDFVCP